MAATLSMGLLVLTAGALRPDGGTRSHPAASAFSSRISILRGGSEGVREKAGESGAAVRGKDAANSEDETFTFQAEMSELMSLLINTFYSNKDIFLRELVSNAADAIDKARLGRTGPEPADSATADGSAGCVGALDSGAPDSDFAIRLRADCAANTLTIEDNGIGMDRRDLVQFLGTVASSGTKAFMRSADSKLRRAHDGAREGGDAADSEGAEASGAEESTTAGSATSPASALIGQFGVGFYSAFLVAQHVAVYSRMRGGPLLVWESDASGSFRVRQPAVAEVRARVGADSGLASGGCGTAVVLRLKAGEEAFLAEATLADLVRTHCAFISAPVRLWARRRRLPSDPPPADEAEEDGVWDWRPLNAQRPLWLREPGEVGEGEYATFFRALSGETVAMAASAPSRSGGLGGELGAHAAERLPVARIHFEIDTARPGVALPRRIARLHRQAGSPRLQLRVLLFVGPPRAPASRGARDARAARARGGVGVGGGVRLYVRRVYVCDVGPPPAGARAEAGRRGAGEAGSRGLVSHGGVHLPEWALGCVCGVLDSDTIELNVSRERLRGSHAVVAMLVGEIVVARLLALLESMSDSSSDNVSDGQSGAEACVSDGRSGAEAFDAFYGAYATQLKLGVLEDEGARGRLLALLRFPSTRTGAVPAAGDTAAAAAAAEAAAGGAGGDAASGGGAADAAGSARLGGAPDRPLLASEMTTLAAYVSRMPREQKAIYYLSGESLRAIRAMPALERVTSRGFEVLLLAEPIDEYVLATVTAYKGKPLLSAAAEVLDRIEGDGAAPAGGAAGSAAAGASGDSSESARASEGAEQAQEEGGPAAALCAAMGALLEGRVDKVVISSRLTASPCALVTASHGWSAGMERFLAAHAARDASDAASAGGATTPLLRTARKSLEINQRHPVIAELARRAAARPHDPAVRELALLLYETALLDSGFALEEPAAFTRRVHQAILLGLENADTTAAPSDADDRSR